MGSGAGDQSRVAADQAESQARMNRLQGQMTRGNITLMSDALTTSLDRYDQAAGQTLGSTALQLARTGNLSRKRSGYSTAADLGIENLASSNPVDAIRKEMSGLIGATGEYRSQIDALDQELAELGSIDDLESQIDQIEADFDNDLRGDARREAFDEMNRAREAAQDRIKEINKKSREIQKKKEELTSSFESEYGDVESVESYVELLEESVALIDKTAEKINTEANESIDRQIAGTYTVGSTHTQMSKMLQQVMMQRDDILNNGLNQMFTTAQQAVMLDKSAAEADKMAADYRDLAMDQDYNAMLQTVLSGTFMVAGAVGGGLLAGNTIAGASLGMSAGQAGGSFLGNAFARR